MKRIFSLAAMLVLGGCATVKPVALDVKALEGRRIDKVAATEHPMPAMSAITPTKAQFGFLGNMAMNAAGKKIIESHDVADPASSVSRSLAGRLATIFGGEALPPGGVVEGADAAEIVAASGDADVVVDVRTSVWQLIYYKSAWGTYSITYRANARFIDAASEAVLGTGSCAVRPEKGSEWTAGYSDFEENRDGILTRTLSHVAEQCAEQIGGQLAEYRVGRR
ncbi:hypothetical protein [Alloalcanivorax marinus]|uniref:hypothetical protein n=1 Tax=Alloalcanivorax marinus TaxID=1177169 RepID=UPI0019330916|nr:hypothetical protein [Alloalcanivorax marinus]MBL7249126.1 hypothetical protein [Alloalcanivorax marinus]